jgi:hypothetical protein
MVGIIIAAISAAVSTYGAYSQGQAQKAMNDYNARVAEQKAIAKAQAIEAEKKALIDATRAGQAELRASTAGRNLDMMSGSPLLQLAESAKEHSYNILEKQREIDIAKLTGDTTSSLLRTQADLAGKAGAINAGSALLKGAATTYSAYEDWKGAKIDAEER